MDLNLNTESFNNSGKNKNIMIFCNEWIHEDVKIEISLAILF